MKTLAKITRSVPKKPTPQLKAFKLPAQKFAAPKRNFSFNSATVKSPKINNNVFSKVSFKTSSFTPKRNIGLLKTAAVIGGLYYGAKYARDTFLKPGFQKDYQKVFDESLLQISKNQEKIQKILGTDVQTTALNKTQMHMGYGPSKAVHTIQWSFPAGDAGEVVCLAIDPPTGTQTLADVTVLKYPAKEQWGLAGLAKKELESGKYKDVQAETLSGIQKWVNKSYSHGISGDNGLVALNEASDKFVENPNYGLESTNIYHADVPIQKSFVTPIPEDTTLNHI